MTHSNKILIVDDEEDICKLVQGILEDEGYYVEYALTVHKALEKFQSTSFDVAVLDIWLNDGADDGIGLMQELLKHSPHLPIIMMSGHSTVETAVESIKKGAYDFIEKPFKTDRLLVMVERGIELQKLKNENKDLKDGDGSIVGPVRLVGRGQAISKFKTELEEVSLKNQAVLLSGSKGSNILDVAQYIHQTSQRAELPCVHIDGAVVDHSQLIKALGSVKGGSLIVSSLCSLGDPFLDVILTHVKEHRDRVIVISDSVSSHSVSEKLASSLELTNLSIPSLVERYDDLFDLVDDYYERSFGGAGLSKKFTRQSAATLQQYKWPGDVSQLYNFIEWLVIMELDRQSDIEASDLPSYFFEEDHDEGSHGGDAVYFFEDCMGASLKEARERFEKIYLEEQLVRFDYNISKASGFIGMERSALHRKLKSLSINTSNDMLKKQKSIKEA